MNTEIFFYSMYDIDIALLCIATGIFIYLAIQSKTIKSFQFQISVFVTAWTAIELIDELSIKGLVNLGIFEHVGLQIHLATTIFLSLIFLMRYYKSKPQRRLADKFKDELV